MEKLPTAEEILEKYNKKFEEEGIVYDLSKPMIEFAKLHVEAALKAASEKVKTKTVEEYISKSGEYEYSQYPDKDSILNAYPLTLIK